MRLAAAALLLLAAAQPGQAAKNCLTFSDLGIPFPGSSRLDRPAVEMNRAPNRLRHALRDRAGLDEGTRVWIAHQLPDHIATLFYARGSCLVRVERRTLQELIELVEPKR